MSLPVVLFACIHNSGRSVAARLLTEHHANGAVIARSAFGVTRTKEHPTDTRHSFHVPILPQLLA